MKQSASNMLFPLYVQMNQALGPSASTVFPLESAGTVYPLCDQADLFQSFSSGAMENQCSMGLLDMALPHAPQYPFQKQVIVAWKKMQYTQLMSWYAYDTDTLYLFFSATGFLGGECPECAAYGPRAKPGECGFGAEFRWFV